MRMIENGSVVGGDQLREEPDRRAVRLRAFWTISSGLGTSNAKDRENVEDVEIRSGAFGRKFHPLRGGEDVSTSSSASKAANGDGGAGRMIDEYLVDATCWAWNMGYSCTLMSV